MKIGIIGCGNVGSNTLKAFYAKNLHVCGYDTSSDAQARIVAEVGLKNTAHSLKEIITCDTVFSCVPTAPMPESGACDLSIFESIVKEFAVLESDDTYACRLFVQRSTCPPGSAERFAKYFRKTAYAVNPSFLGKHTQWADSINPSRIAFAGDLLATQLLEQIYSGFTDAPRFVTETFETVELLKYAENITDAVLISLWNEILQLSDSFRLPRTEFIKLIEAFVQRPRFGTAFRVPGKAFGLECLPKDLAALLHDSNQQGMSLNVMLGAQKTNRSVQAHSGINSLPTTELFSVVDGRVILSDTAKDFLSVMQKNGDLP
ncbi:MAG: NAD(P)-binding domain-containing protein [Deltaproteobacteria bacterium]|nr:NAD(P)-binding domain-containing protein [Deltaproteobacteria bacterium]